MCEPRHCEGLSLESDVALLQDAEAHRMIKCMVSLLRHRAASCSWHTHGYPGLLALLAHSDKAVVKRGLAQLKEHIEALEWARTASPEAVAMANRNLMNGAAI